jgi:hypothetical protein
MITVPLDDILTAKAMAKNLREVADKAEAGELSLIFYDTLSETKHKESGFHLDLNGYLTVCSALERENYDDYESVAESPDGDEFNCVDCGRDTTTEYYMVHDHVWEQEAGMKNNRGMLCIECFEKRIGRRLTAADFTEAMVNHDTPEHYSPLLQNRLSGNPKRTKRTFV